MIGDLSVGFRSAGGDEALDRWRRLRAVHPSTGYWPVLLPTLDRPGPAAPGAAERLDRMAQVDVDALVDATALDSTLRQDLLDRWPDEVQRLDGFGLPYRRDGGPSPVTVALVEAADGWQVPVLLDFGSVNDCPEPAVHGAVLRRWQDRYGAELVCLTGRGLELAVARPPRTRADALAFAWEYASYCADGLDLYYADGLPELAACLIDADVVRLWWD